MRGKGQVAIPAFGVYLEKHKIRRKSREIKYEEK